MSVLHNTSKASVVGDAFSHMTMCSVSDVKEEQKELKNVYMLSRLGVCYKILQMVV